MAYRLGNELLIDVYGLAGMLLWEKSINENCRIYSTGVE